MEILSYSSFWTSLLTLSEFMRIRTVDQVEEAPYSPEILQCASASQKRARLFVATEWTLSLKGDNTTQQKKKNTASWSMKSAGPALWTTTCKFFQAKNIFSISTWSRRINKLDNDNWLLIIVHAFVIFSLSLSWWSRWSYNWTEWVVSTRRKWGTKRVNIILMMCLFFRLKN